VNKFILSLNCGSSSLKFNLFKLKEPNILVPYLKGIIEEIGNTEISKASFSCGDQKKEFSKPVGNHAEALQLIFDEFLNYGIKKADILAAGHRVVHGGEKMNSSMRINDEVIENIRTLIPLAPLHNAPNLTGIIETIKLLPEVPQVAVFDTAFHATLPEYAYRYAVPERWRTEFGVRKYGFHGMSHMYVSKRAARLLGIKYNRFNCITAHLGNGCSITKIIEGKSVDTSMGFTPLQGVIMGTRSGDIDPALIPHVAENIAGADGADILEAYRKVFRDLNKESGLKALSGTNMMQIVREKALKGDEASENIISLYAYRIAQYIGAYWATMPRIDAVVFTAGLGENEGYVRKRILEFLAHFDISVDSEKNSLRKREIIIGSGCGTPILVIPTDEEIVIGYDALYLGYFGQKLPEEYPFETAQG
jgi:acetate kinase